VKQEFIMIAWTYFCPERLYFMVARSSSEEIHIQFVLCS